MLQFPLGSEREQDDGVETVQLEGPWQGYVTLGPV